MSTDQVSKPRAAKKSMTDESERPGTCRSKVGCDAMDEPCTNRMVPSFSGAGERFSHMKSLTSPFCVQCSWPCTLMFDMGLFIGWLHLLKKSFPDRGETRCTGWRRPRPPPDRPPRSAAADGSARAARGRTRARQDIR